MKSLTCLVLFISLASYASNSCDLESITSKIVTIVVAETRNKPNPLTSIRSLIRQTNITRPSNISSTGIDPNFHYFIYNAKTGEVVRVNLRDVEVERFSSLREFFEQFELESAFFPFVYDVQNPNQLIFGIGGQTILNSGERAHHTLLRNGGHYQLASRYRRSNIPDLNGLFAGGLTFNGGDIHLLFRSRSVNQTSGGYLPRAVERELDGAIRSIFR